MGLGKGNMKKYKEYDKCNLCPRECGAQRNNNKKGICGTANQIIVARAALHYWEEPCISGEKGSGAVFFGGCNLHCVFCQNQEISCGQSGKVIDESRLAEIFLELMEKGANNINLVTPGHYLPQIISAVEKARNQGMNLPIVYNCGGYEKVDSIRRLEGIVDVYLPDFKYFSSDISQKYSNAKDYAQVAKLAIEEMVRQQNKCVFDQQKIIKKGVVEYVGPVSISMADRLKKPISSYDFFFVLQQIVDIVRKAQKNNLVISRTNFLLSTILSSSKV